MNKEHEPFVYQSASLPHKLRWPMYLLMTATTVVSAFLSLLIATFSVNMVVIQISIWTSIVCFAFVLGLVSRNRNGYAFLLSLIITPITIGLSVLYFNTRTIPAEVVQKLMELRHSIVAKFVDPQPSLDRAIQAGSIRKATAQDIRAFRDAYIEKKYLKKGLLVPKNEDALSVTRVDASRAYVILKKFTYPSGLVNEYRVVFFIPMGVPEPNGKYGHSAIYHYDTLTVECTAARTGGMSC